MNSLKQHTDKKQHVTRWPHQFGRSAVAFGLAILITVVGLVVLGLGYERVYADRFYPGVRVLGVQMGGMTFGDGRALVTARAGEILGHSIALTFPDGSQETVTSEQLGLSLAPDDLLASAFERGREGTYFQRWSELVLLRTAGAVYAFNPVVDQQQLAQTVDEIAGSHKREAVNANLSIADGQLAISLAQAGSTIDSEALVTTLSESIRSLDLPHTLTVPGEVIEPTLTEDALKPALAEAQRLVSVPIQLLVDETTQTITTETLTGWLTATQEADGATLTWNKDAIAYYVASLAKKVNHTMEPRKIEDGTNNVLAEGKVGRSLDQAHVQRSLLSILESRQRETGPITKAETIELQFNEVPIEEKHVPAVSTPGLYPGKYLEVNLKTQRLYQYQGSELVGTYTVSTGKWDTPTPEGTLYIKNHISRAYSKPYDLYMPWWLGLAWNQDGSGYEGYGIHELPEWRNGRKEGQSHLGTPVSHGCIRLGVGDSKIIYDWAEEGMPVVIHR